MTKYVNIRKIEKLHDEIQIGFMDKGNFQKQSILYYESAIKKCRLCLMEMKKHVIGYMFRNVSDEIYFFKTLKPGVNSYLLYFLEIHHIETLWVDAKDTLKKKLNKKRKEVNCFIQNHYEFYRCYKSKLNYMDDILFTRKVNDIYWLKDDPSYVVEPEFSSGGDYLLSRILAYEKLKKYLNTQSVQCDPDKEAIGGTLLDAGKQKLAWTESKVALVELIYSLYYSNAINMGNIEIKQLASVFEDIFDIELNDFYHTYTEIRNRKKDRIKFLDLLRNTLIRRMDELDGIN